ncbi:MAG TPA: glycoside hydrolase family 36 protein [Bryobacteraceae bacterium]|jgi:alpha-galactosidase|nr:glycoside hydrolase family 36 protein [Bryobacteraceae bacterium]
MQSCFRRITCAGAVAAALWPWKAIPAADHEAKVEGKNIRLEFDHRMYSRVIARFDGKETVIGPFSPSETVTANGATVSDFALQGVARRNVRDQIGDGEQTTLTGTAGTIEKTVIVNTYSHFPEMAFFRVRYTNRGKDNIRITGWSNNHYSITAGSDGASPAFWSYESGSYEKRPDWVMPLKTGFKQENYLGMNATDYGGGTPVVDVWRRDIGIGIGHVELTAKLVSMPVAMPDAGSATLGLSFRPNETLHPGGSIETFRSFASVHQGDYFRTLRAYSDVMQAQGVHLAKAPDSAFEPIWCAWGYGRPFTPSQVIGALPVVKKLGFSWVGVDDGWQSSDGDWGLVKTKFPNGDADMRSLVDRIHREGFRAQLWWAPLAAKPDSEVAQHHPEYLLLNANGSKQKISYWNDWYLCPADAAVIEHHRQLVIKMFRDWDYDGLKLDGQHMNAVPPCFNPAHKHKRPEESVEDLAKFFQMIYDTARSIKPDALVEWCPCGTAFNFYNLPNLNMSVASDPHNSWQVRTKGKSLKALHGDGTAYFGDHVELSDGRRDFASTVGIGGVVGTQFTWPVGSGRRPTYDLSPEKEATWQKWISLYKEKMLSRGEYLGGLYDIGFDRPEAHAIRKSGAMYYAFYAPQFQGKVELRGLERRTYKVHDYENDRDLGTVRGPNGSMEVQFTSHLLLEAKPE